MTTRTPLAKLALRRLADADPDIVAPTSDDADAATLAIARELEAIRRGTRRRRALMAGAALAASVLVVVGVARALLGANDSVTATAREVSGGVLVVRRGDGKTLAPGAAIQPGDRVVASAAGSATLALRRGTELRAHGGADLVVTEYSASEVFDLRAGSIDLHVAKLESGERFIVRTSDAEVEVRGTQFRVEVGEQCQGTSTHVKVTEGVVVVRHAKGETRVAMNESWPADCTTAAVPSAAAPASASPSTVTSLSTATAVAVTPRPAAAIPPAPMASSELAEQNALYADAMAAKRRGDSTSALAALDHLLVSHPRGPLAESAMVERMRILAPIDRVRAAEAARAYLARHPNGHAREEARALIGGP